MKLVKRLLVGLLILVGVLAVVTGAVMVKTFGTAAPLPATGLIADGKALLISDGDYVGVFVVPLATEGHVLLVDCGNDPEAKTVKAALFDKKLTVDAIFVTHGHPDHIGGCDALRAGGVPVYALTTEAETMMGDTALPSPIGTMMGAHHLGVKIDRPLQDGDVTVIDGTSVKAFALPGHTAGSVAYLIDGVLFLGDAATLGKDGHPIAPPWVFSNDVHEAARSLAKLGAQLNKDGTPVEWMAFAHSAPWQVTSPAQLLELAVQGPANE